MKDRRKRPPGLAQWFTGPGERARRRTVSRPLQLAGWGLGALVLLAAVLGLLLLVVDL